ncbi:MAG TPA: DUF4190 domain-containing protein [Candidatus Saccharibacteria bacterium]|nr:DUF4190 domain-containing protein [Candidatus Saccharibacteria bacterium]
MTHTEQHSQKEGQGFAITSLVLGIVTLPLSVFGYIALLPAILAIIFGALSFNSKKGRKKAIAGFIMGIIGAIFGLVMAMVVIPVAFSSLQRTVHDAERKNDVSVISSDVVSFQSQNRGQLPSANDITTFGLAQVKFIADIGIPTTDTAVLHRGIDCDGVSSSRNYAITILLEDGSTYCRGS